MNKNRKCVRNSNSRIILIINTTDFNEHNSLDYQSAHDPGEPWLEVRASWFDSIWFVLVEARSVSSSRSLLYEKALEHTHGTANLPATTIISSCSCDDDDDDDDDDAANGDTPILICCVAISGRLWFRFNNNMHQSIYFSSSYDSVEWTQD